MKAVMRTHKLFVSQISPDTKSEDIKELLSEAGIECVRCNLLPPRYEGQHWISFCVEISEAQSEKARDENLWPEGATVRRFFSRPPLAATGANGGNS